jgi:hypothetical protein
MNTTTNNVLAVRPKSTKKSVPAHRVRLLTSGGHGTLRIKDETNTNIIEKAPE